MNTRQILEKLPKKALKKIESGEHRVHFQHDVQCITLPLDYYYKIMNELNQRRK